MGRGYPHTCRMALVRPQEIPQLSRARLQGRPVDWADRFVADLTEVNPTSRPRTAQEWARAIFEDPRGLPARVRSFGPLGLTLSRPQPPGGVAVWQIAGEAQDWILLRAERPLIIEQILVEVDASSVALTTALQFTHPLGRLAWQAAVVPHRIVAPRVLGRAVRLHSDPLQ